MNKYKIPCFWQMYAIMTVEADSLEEAIDIAENESELPDGNYVDGSFEVDHDVLDEWNG